MSGAQVMALLITVVVGAGLALCFALIVWNVVAITIGVIADHFTKGHSQREETIRQTGDPNGRP